MKVHTGSDRRGIVHSLTTTHAGEADVTQLPRLPQLPQVRHGEERRRVSDSVAGRAAGAPNAARTGGSPAEQLDRGTFLIEVRNNRLYFRASLEDVSSRAPNTTHRRAVD
jgi:hypothetical protein